MLAIGFILTLVACFVVFDSKRQSYWHQLHECYGNARHITDALVEYRTKWGSPPPLYTTNKHGERLHSWRTLLLPYLGNSEMYDELRLDEPWDSAHNREIADRYEYGGLYFQCPVAAGGRLTEASNSTSYLAISGRGPRWERRIKLHSAVRHRQPMNPVVLLVTEVRDSNIHWMEPTDISIASPKDAFDENAARHIGSNHSNGLWKWTRKPFHVIYPLGNDIRPNSYIRQLDSRTEMQVLKDQISGAASLSN